MLAHLQGWVSPQHIVLHLHSSLRAYHLRAWSCISMKLVLIAMRMMPLCILEPVSPCCFSDMKCWSSQSFPRLRNVKNTDQASLQFLNTKTSDIIKLLSCYLSTLQLYCKYHKVDLHFLHMFYSLSSSLEVLQPGTFVLISYTLFSM